MPTVTKTKTQFLSALLLLFGWICIGISMSGFMAKTIILPILFKNYTAKTQLLTMHASVVIGGIIAGPLMYWYYVEKKTISYFFLKNNRTGQLIFLMIVLTVLAMIINTIVSYWNMQLQFPAFLKSFENWSKQQQIELKSQLALLTTSHSIYDLLATISVVGVLTAIGEELVCRGILQDLLYRTTANEHISIIIASLIFSAIHLDPYAFFPRFLMGLLLGYIYTWTNNLLFPIFSHLLNNSLILILSFLEKRNLVNLSEDNQLPWQAVIGCCVMAMVTIFYFKRQTSRKEAI